MSDFTSLITTTEELHPDLCDHISTVESLPMLQHPLVFSIPYSPKLNALLNAQYHHKRQEAETALQDQQWTRYIYLHERPFRFEALSAVAAEIDDDTAYWDAVSTVWIDSENGWQHLDEWETLLTDRTRGHREALMHPSEHASLTALPSEITIYRGFSGASCARSLSWTTSRTTAIWFANRFAAESAEAYVAQATVRRGDVIAFFTRRKESEIVASPNDIDNLTVDRIS